MLHHVGSYRAGAVAERGTLGGERTGMWSLKSRSNLTRCTGTGAQPCTHSQEVILGYLVRGVTEEEILAEYPTLAYQGALPYEEGKMKLIEANM